MDDPRNPSSDDSGFEEQPDQFPRSTYESSPASKLPQLPLEAVKPLPSLTVQPLTGYGYSLLPDMLFGWQPKLVHGGPIPLLFNKVDIPISRNHLTDEENFVVFHGFRPKDSLIMHRAYSSPDTYPVPNYPTMQVYEYLHRKDQTLKDTRPFVGMNPDCDPTDLEFDSTFESGNLDMAVRVHDTEYDLYMRADANTRGHHQWYYFAANAPAVVDVRFNILNFTKNESLYTHGMLPFVFSEATAELGWHRAGTNIRYKTSKINPYTRRCYYCLSFNYTFRHPQQRVFFAYAIPYTYTRLRKLVVELSTGREMLLKRETLCKSLSGVEVPLLTVTNFSVPVSQKQSVVVTGRVHPGETYGSFMMESLRNRLVFHIVPMLNPDGVIVGNYRTGFAGCDLNRQFQRPNFVLHPTVTALKTLITKVWKEHELLAFLDLHAHSKQKCVFMYGPHYPLHSDKYYKMRVLPRLICSKSQLFRYTSCKFRNERSKRKAARLVIWKEFKLANSYTVEASFYGYLTPERITIPFDEESVLSAGKAIAEGLDEYLHLQESEAVEKEKKRKKRKIKKNKMSIEVPKADNPQEPQVEAVSPQKTVENETVDELPDVPKEDDRVPDATETADAADAGDGSDSSDGDSSEDDLEPADQKQLHDRIAAVMEEFSELSTNPKTVRPKPTAKRRNRILDKPALDSEARSKLEQYFSKANQLESRRQRSRSKGRAVVPKVYDPIMLSNPGPGYRSVSLKSKEGLARQPTQKELSRRPFNSRGCVETAQISPTKLPADLSTRLSAWLRRRLPQTARRGSRDSEELEDHSTISDCKPMSPIPPIRPIRFGSVHEQRQRRPATRPKLTRQLSINISQTEG